MSYITSHCLFVSTERKRERGESKNSIDRKGPREKLAKEESAKERVTSVKRNREEKGKGCTSSLHLNLWPKDLPFISPRKERGNLTLGASLPGKLAIKLQYCAR